MSFLLTASLSSKSQLTIPKAVRAVLGLHSKGDLVGFIVDPDGKDVKLARMEAVVAQEDFASEDYRKLLRLPKQKGGKRFKTISALVRDLKKE